MIENIFIKNRNSAIIIRNEFSVDGIQFFTPPEFYQQLGYMNRPKGYVILPHTHNTVVREVNCTKEVLFIKTGVVRVDFYDEDQKYQESRILKRGDVILLGYGGHGFEMLEPSEIIEVKQGPYISDDDKTRFNPVLIDQIVIKD